MEEQFIRNFAIIAHIDHGKSTLADRLLEFTGVVENGKHEPQLLDQNPISRERGITIKLAPVTMRYQNQYLLNLVDTPGHVDFSYEVWRTLACVEGVILLVDATKGIQAQTISHTLKAIELGLTIIPVINKIDLPQAQVAENRFSLAAYLGIAEKEVLLISARTGFGVAELLAAITQRIPCPLVQKNSDLPVEAIVFDSYFDEYRGVIAFIRLKQGSISKNQKLKIASGQTAIEVAEVGIFTPELKPQTELTSGQIGYLVTNIKDIHKIRVGDTFVALETAVSGTNSYSKIKPMIFASVFPTDPDNYLNLKKALDKLYLNDAALQFEPCFSQALGSGFRVGFLGMLHAEVTRERLEREFGQDLILTAPQVDYQLENNTCLEPFTEITLVTPKEYLGNVMTLAANSRAIFKNMDNLNSVSIGRAGSQEQIILRYEMPLAELVGNFFDKLKSLTSGYASLDWVFIGYRPVVADKLLILINNEPVEEFSQIVVASEAVEKARLLVKTLHDLIDRQQFEVKIQAQYQGRIIAAERLSPLRKDVTAKLYGGDRSRKDKLLNKQKKGKKLLKQIGKVEISKETFLTLFRLK
jgi:GTP-binding protein LepA